MKESFAYTNTNVECGQKFINNTTNYKIRYIKNLPKFNIFVGTHRFSENFKKYDNIVLMHSCILH